MRKYVLGSVAAFMVVASAGATNAAISFTFDTDNQGWRVGDVSGTVPNAFALAGWELGRLKLSDQANQTGVYAPQAVLGNQSGAYNGSISFDVSDAFNDRTAYAGLILYGNGLAAAVNLGPPSTDNNALTTFTLTLNEANFTRFDGGFFTSATALSQAQFQGILGDLRGIAFTTEYNTGADDSRFDNAVFTGFVDPNAIAPVPEPATWAMMIIGFGAAGSIIRRRGAMLA
jgi:hypothetical protein